MSPSLEVQVDGAWTPIGQAGCAPEQRLPIEAIVRAGQGLPSRAGLPFQPTSYRDFMLYERHVIESGRGMLRRFYPSAFRKARLYEAIRRRTYPAILPHPLWYRRPIYYMGNHLSLVASGEKVASPSYSTALDYELELGFVLSAPLLNASPEEALDAIGAFVVLNDFTARNIQLGEMRSGFGPQKSKHFATSISTVAVTADEILPVIDDLTARVRVNDKEVVTASSSGMRFSLGEVLAHVSRNEQLHPGELLATGTLPGCCAIENDHWLEPGDKLELVIDEIGEISHEISGATG